MSGRGPRTREASSLRVYRWLVRFYPEPFRREYGILMIDLFRELLAETAPRPARRARLWLKTLGDLARSLVHEHLTELAIMLRRGSRSLRRSPGVIYSTVPVLATTASLVLTLLLASRQWSPPGVDDLHWIWGERRFGLSSAEVELLQHELEDLVPRTARFSKRTTVRLEHDGSVTLRQASIVSKGFFELVGAEALHGSTRSPTPDERPPVVLSWSTWRERFEGAEDVLGQELLVDGQPVVVTGVLPATFGFPDADTEIWLPRELEASPPRSGAGTWALLGRLDSTLRDQASDRLEQARRQVADWYPPTQVTGLDRASLTPFSEFYAGAREDRLHLLVLAALVAALALGWSASAVRRLPRRRDPRTRRGTAWLIGLSAMLAALLLAAGLDFLGFLRGGPTLRGPLSGGWPLLLALAGAGVLLLRLVLARASDGCRPRVPWLRGASLTAAVAGALLAVHEAEALVRLSEIDLGFGTEDRQVFALELPTSVSRSAARKALQGLEDHLQATPGVDSAGVVQAAPGGDESWRVPFELREGGRTRDGVAEMRVVSAAGLAALDLTVPPLREGDDPGAEVAWVNEAFIRRYAGGHLAPETTLRSTFLTPSGGPIRVTGTIADVRYRGPLANEEPAIYRPFCQQPLRSVRLIVRGERSGPELSATIRRWAETKELPLGLRCVGDLEDALDRSWSHERSSRGLRAGIALGGVLLALGLAWPDRRGGRTWRVPRATSG